MLQVRVTVLARFYAAKPCSNVTPGGWVEFQDWDTRLHSEDRSTHGTSLQQYYDLTIPAFNRLGVEPAPGPHLEGWFREAGFVDIHVEKFLIPLGAWPKDKRLVCILSYS